MKPLEQPTASNTDSLVPVVGTSILGIAIPLTVVVFQTKTGLVPLGNAISGPIDHIEMSEHFHAVIVTMARMPQPFVFASERFEINSTNVLDASREAKQATSVVDPF